MSFRRVERVQSTKCRGHYRPGKVEDGVSVEGRILIQRRERCSAASDGRFHRHGRFVVLRALDGFNGHVFRFNRGGRHRGRRSMGPKELDNCSEDRTVNGRHGGGNDGAGGVGLELLSMVIRSRRRSRRYATSRGRARVNEIRCVRRVPRSSSGDGYAINPRGNDFALALRASSTLQGPS